ncbi:MAG: Na/Pi cotransporter family protein, partial [Planctomycetes bacterium]|nr:Na/Pi cotransporter family protein [Planctomycetota bacterium]
SSSACTVMVIGFVNAGLMKLEQAIGVVMGSNIGTTVTAQMISFKLETMAMPAIAVGVIISLLAKKSHTRFAAQILIGFGILFMGMGMMAEPLKELKDSETLQSMFHNLSCSPINGSIPFEGVIKAVAAGTMLTVIVQSSSASIGLLLALSGAGLLDIYTSFAILLGDNIGTTITAILASIGSTKAAKRAACAHCIFNLLGTTIMVILLFVEWPGTGHPVFMELVTLVTDGNPFAGENLPRFLANAHTLFNTSCTVMFVGFVGVFAKICRIIIPGEESDIADRPRRLLDQRLLATPSIAIQQTWSELGFMLEQGRCAQSESFQAAIDVENADWTSLNESIRSHEDDIDKLQNAVTKYLSDISMETLNEEQGKIIPHLLHSVNDIERIGDHSMNILRLAKRIRKRELIFSDGAVQQLKQMEQTLDKLFEHCASAIKLVSTESSTEGERIRAEENLGNAKTTHKLLKDLEKEFRKAHVERHESGECNINSGVVFLDLISNMHRVGSHLINIVEAASIAVIGE